MWPSVSQTEGAAYAKVPWWEEASEDQGLRQANMARSQSKDSKVEERGRGMNQGRRAGMTHHVKAGGLHPENNRKSLEAFKLAGTGEMT